MIRLAILVACLASLGNPTGDAAAHLAKARSLIEAGQNADALTEAIVGLEYDPDSPELLQVAARAAAQAGRKDEAIWYEFLGLDALRTLELDEEDPEAEPARAKAIVGVRESLGSLDARTLRGTELHEVYAASMLELGKLCLRKKNVLNAIDLFERCKGTALEPEIEAQLERIYKSPQSVEALLASGVDVPFQIKRGLSPSKIARGDKQHAEWDKRWELKDKNYTVESNMGYVMTEDILRAMEQMNLFYREVFRYKERGGGTRRCTLYVYRSRSEFDLNEGREEPIPAGVRGFFNPAQTSVHTYDPRTDGRPLSSLWSTLFHEASHQFINLLLPNLCPTWLNEGTASYFEGARLLGNGSVETNLIPDGRLRALRRALDQGDPTLRDVVSYFKPGSYPGKYYPVGWGLVYFMLNYENERSERIYEPIYQEFIQAYKGGGQHDVFDRFVEYFVEKVGDKEVQTFDDFQKRFEAWIHELNDIHFGPVGGADRLIERGRRQRDAKQLENAVESYQWSLRKRPGDAAAHFDLAEVYERQKNSDAALVNYRRAMQVARSAADRTSELPRFEGKSAEAVETACIERIAKFDAQLAEGLSKAHEAFASEVLVPAKALHEDGMPRAALRLIEDAAKTLGGDGRLSALHAQVLGTGVDRRRWRRLWVGNELAEAAPAGPDTDWKQIDGGVRGSSKALELLLHPDPVPERFRFQAALSVSELDPEDVFGFVYGVNEVSDMQLFIATGAGQLAVFRFGEEQEVSKDLKREKPEALKDIRLAIEVEPTKVRYFLGDKEVGDLEYNAGDLMGQLGLVVQGCRVDFTELRMLY